MRRIVIRWGVASLGVGFFVAMMGFMLWVFLVMATILAFLVLLLAISSDRKTQTNTKKYPVLVFSFLMLTSLLALATLRLKDHLLLKEANQVVAQLEQYKLQKGSYPHKLDSLSMKQQLVKLHYEVDSSRLHYQIAYDTDGWNVNSYDSQHKEWIEED